MNTHQCRHARSFFRPRDGQLHFASRAKQTFRSKQAAACSAIPVPSRVLKVRRRRLPYRLSASHSAFLPDSMRRGSHHHHRLSLFPLLFRFLPICRHLLVPRKILSLAILRLLRNAPFLRTKQSLHQHRSFILFRDSSVLKLHVPAEDSILRTIRQRCGRQAADSNRDGSMHASPKMLSALRYSSVIFLPVFTRHRGKRQQYGSALRQGIQRDRFCSTHHSFLFLRKQTRRMRLPSSEQTRLRAEQLLRHRLTRRLPQALSGSDAAD